MSPDFNQKTVDTLAKRASYKCSNPECRTSTVGPNADPSKSTLIGEAAHIHGARPQSKRYVSTMTDAARAEITNGIWLCRNCHKLIDSDDARYTGNILFAWRELHENFILSELGSATDKLLLEQKSELLSAFNGYPSIIHRIVLDKPDGWEYRLAAELLRYFNAPYFRRIQDLQDGCYVKPRVYIEESNALNWISQRMGEAVNTAKPIEKLLPRLVLSFGRPGEPGDLQEIHHICSLIKDYIAEAVKYEESLYFSSVPDKAKRAIELLKNCLSSQVEKLKTLPMFLDEFVSMMRTDHGGAVENPRVVRKEINFELPHDWLKKMESEIEKIGA